MMKFNYWVERTIRRYEDSPGKLLRFYLEYRLNVLGKDEPSLEDIEESRNKALASVFRDQVDESEMEFDTESAKRACNDNNPANWRTPRELARALQRCS